MQRWLAAWAAGTIVWSLGLSPQAQDAALAAPLEKPAAGDRSPRGERVKGEAEKLQKVLRDLNLTEAQQKQADQILDTHRQAAVNWMKEHGDDLKAAKAKLEAAQKTNDPAKLRGAREAMAKASANRLDQREALLKQLSEVLTKEQMDKVRAALPARPEARADRPLAMLERLGLDDKQKERVRAILAAAGEAASKPDGEPRRKALKEALEKIRTTVLTDDQRKKLDAMKPPAASEPASRAAKGDVFAALQKLRETLKLTDDQKAKIDGIVKTTKENIASAKGGDAKRTALRDGWKKIEEALTPEQKAVLEKWRKEHGGQGLGERLRDARKRLQAAPDRGR